MIGLNEDYEVNVQKIAGQYNEYFVIYYKKVKKGVLKIYASNFLYLNML
jgi:hypothetical protein